MVTLLGVALFRNQLAMISPWMDHGDVAAYLSRNPTANRFRLVRPLVFPSNFSHIPIYIQCAQIASGLEYLHGINIVSQSTQSYDRL